MSACWPGPEAAFDGALQHYVQLAQKRGCWAFAEQQVLAMDGGPSRLYAGLHAAWRAQITALGFEPHPDELGQWWKVKSEAERHPWRPARRAGR